VTASGASQAAAESASDAESAASVTAAAANLAMGNAVQSTTTGAGTSATQRAVEDEPSTYGSD
jgi:hypothetical protein